MHGRKRNMLLLWLPAVLVFMLPLVLAAAPALANDALLNPPVMEYEDGNIKLSKTAEQVSADEWKVTVMAEIGEFPIQKRKIEVVFVLDCSGSMAWCTDETEHNKGSHDHSSSCYGTEYICNLEGHIHEENCYSTEECTSRSNPDHWEGWIIKRHIDGTTCKSENNGRKYYPLICTKHMHSDWCKLICNRDKCTHTTTNGGNSPCTYTDANGNKVQYKSRLQAAKETITSTVANLTKDGGDNISIKYVTFSASNNIKVVTSLDAVEAEGGTYMYTGIEKGIAQFSNDDNKKVLVVLTDGAANDKLTKAPSLADFKDPDKTDGTVFTVGFAYSNSQLASIAGNGGKYVHAGNSIELDEAMKDIEVTLTAMLEDPMGAAVGFDKSSIVGLQTSGGTVSSSEDTIYWHPAQDGTDTVRNSTIKYSYVVKLNDEADMNSGEHTVKLNNPTYFRYGFKDGNGNTEMKEVAFPIPEAYYTVSTMQTMWQDRETGEDIQKPLDEEPLVNNFANSSFIPTFKQDYKTITDVIHIDGSNDYYRYVGTVVTADGQEIESVDAVDTLQAVSYVVVHQYERVNSNELAVNGTKVLVGRDFMQGDEFTFVLTPDDPSYPMPELSRVTIRPEYGASAAFSFGTISYDAAGENEYTYTIWEERGTLDDVIYEEISHRLMVNTWEEPIVNGTEIVVSYTMDGVAEGVLTVLNSLETGALKVEKRSVNSHLEAHQEKEFGFLVNAKDMSGRNISGEYPLTGNAGTAGTIVFTDGFATLSLKAGQYAVIDGLPDGTTYEVTEDAAGGFTVTAQGDRGTIEAHKQQTAVFDNAYQSAGLYQFIVTKQLQDKELEMDAFSFSVLDENGNVVANGKNNSDGKVYLDTLYFTQDNIGTKVYTIVENPGTEPGILYDKTRYAVTLTIEDDGEGMLNVTDNLNGVTPVFINKYIKNQFVVSKTVNGNIGSRNQEFAFSMILSDMAGATISVSRDGGNTFESLTLKTDGKITFTLKHDQSLILYPVTGKYVVIEEQTGDYVTCYSVDGGTVMDGGAVSGTLEAEGGHVAFINTLQTALPTGVTDSTACAFAGLVLALALMMIQKMGGGCARHE